MMTQLRIADCPPLRVNYLRIAKSGYSDCARIFNPQSAIRNPKSRGLSLIEVIASTMIVGMLAVATLNGLGAATRSADSIGNRAIAAGLADELMSEILQQPYSDPQGAAVFGRETGEPSSPRSAFDDVDDYDGWTASPPQYRDGSIIPNRTLWRQTVQITRVSPASPTTTVPTEQGAKRIRITIQYNNRTFADQYAVRTDTDDQ